MPALLYPPAYSPSRRFFCASHQQVYPLVDNQLFLYPTVSLVVLSKIALNQHMSRIHLRSLLVTHLKAPTATQLFRS